MSIEPGQMEFSTFVSLMISNKPFNTAIMEGIENQDPTSINAAFRGQKYANLDDGQMKLLLALNGRLDDLRALAESFADGSSVC